MPTYPTNTLQVIGMVTREHLRVIENNLVMTKHVRRDFDDEYEVTGAKIGTTLNIRLPIRPTVTDGPSLPGTIQNTVENVVPLVLNKRKLVALAFSTQEISLNIDDWSSRIVEPSAAAIANQIDFDGLGQFVNVNNQIGTVGTVPNALPTYLSAVQRLNEESTPRSQRALVISPGMEASIIGALTGLFNPPQTIADQYKTGSMGLALGLKWNMDQNVNTYTYGAQGGTPTVNGASQTGSSLVTHGWTASITGLLNAGDVITLAGVHAVNHQSYQSTGALRNFVVTAAVNSDGTGNATIPIYPAITPTSGSPNTVQGATVDASPANSAAITVLGGASASGPQALAFHKEAFALGCADLLLPGGVDIAVRQRDPQVGLSVRYIRAYDVNTDNLPFRVDVLYGWKTLYPEFAVRIAS